MKKNEELLSKKRAIELWDKNIIDEFEVGTYRSLQQIHSYLFQDVFEFAGKTREVNISKGNFRFVNTLFLKSNLEIIDKMPESNFDEIIDKYVELNVAHPFLEGNGRATRIWLDYLLKRRINKCIDWSKINKNDYLSAMERSPVNSLEIKTLLKKSLTEDINNRQIYMRGIQQSYIYEDLKDYDINEI